MRKFLAYHLSALIAAALLVFSVAALAQDSIDTPTDNRLAKDGVTGIPIGQQRLYYGLSNDKLRPVTETQGVPTAYADGPVLDAFGRLRVSNPSGVFQSKNIHSSNPTVFEERTSGGGSSIAFNGNAASVDLTVGTGATDFAVRQSVRYIAYVPGKSQRITQSFKMAAPKTGVTQEVGYGDDLNGIFLEQAGNSPPRWFIRSNTSGSPVENGFSQANWNVDTLDGSGDEGNPSGVDLDLTKVELTFIDFQWQGVGRVRVGFLIGGKITIAHEFNHSNIDTSVFMRTPSLPMRYKIYNTEVTASPTILQEICTAVESEGGFFPPGLEFSALSDAVATNWRATSTTRTPIFAIRLLNTINGFPNRKTVQFQDAGFFVTGNNAIFEIVHVHAPSAITATWTSVGGTSGVEYSEDITAITGTPSHVIEPQPVAAGQAGKGTGEGLEFGVLNEHSFISQDFESDNSQVFVVYVTSTVGAGAAWTHLTWTEFE